MTQKILRHQDLIVYKKSLEAAMQIFELSKTFPEGGNVFSDGPSPKIVALSSRKYRRSVAKKAVRGSICLQAERCGG